MNFMKALVETDNPNVRAEMTSGPENSGQIAQKALIAISKETGIPVPALMASVMKEIRFVAEGIILERRYPGEATDVVRASKIMEILIRRRSETPVEKRDPMVETIYPRGTALIQQAINAGVSQVTAEMAIVELISSGRYVLDQRGEIVPLEKYRQNA